MGDRDDLISQFTGITGLDADRAKFYLDSSAWQLDVALTSYYDTNEGEGNDDVQVVGGDDFIEEVTPPSPPVATGRVVEPESAKPKPRVGGVSSRVATLSSLQAAAAGGASSDEEEGQAFYAGGSEHSGQQVLGPGKKKKDIVAEMFKSVQEHGAEVVDPSAGSSKRPSTFHGTGYRLGQSSNDTEVVALPSGRKESHTEVTLKLWKEGFSVDDGPIREYADPANREFLDYVRRGEVPRELLQNVSGGEVHLNMEDHRHEDYTQPKSRVKAFSGKGQLLGSPSPTTVGTTKPLDEKDKLANEKEAAATVALDQAAPTTSVQIRLADGSRLVATFNHTHTVADIRRYIATARPQYEHQSFTLLTTFPNKELTQDSQTLADAGLLNAAILQRLT
ncbi:NSFL1 cofactor p47 [Macrosteles quadrilineatus]|uniref:NSFL1 cofactor p47 n=1 Tax=Macrosteles quadrilineatus TaxID=74068 RepID=UPI0023E0BFD6|nr:NSFL1 cofactor p47 [Macrosteles quadrilineatus]